LDALVEGLIDSG